MTAIRIHAHSIFDLGRSIFNDPKMKYFCAFGESFLIVCGIFFLLGA